MSHMQSRAAVDETQSNDVWRIYQTNATVKSCCALIKSSLLVGGIKFNGAKDGEIDRYTTLASSALDWLLCLGVVPVTSEQDARSGQWVPVIPDYTAVCLHVEVTPIGRLKYSATFKHQGTVRDTDTPELWVWAHGNMGPAANGSLRTNITALLPIWELESFLTSRAMVAEHILSNPPMITQDNTKRITEMQGLDSNIGGEEIQMSEIERIRVIENVRHGQYEAYLSNWCGGVPRGAAQYQQFMKQCELSQIYAPAERSVVSGPSAHSCLSQLLHWKEYVAEQVYQLFGVHNPHKSHGDNKNSVRTGSISQDAMNANIKLYSGMIERFLNLCHEVCEQKTKRGLKRKKQKMEEPEKATEPLLLRTIGTIGSIGQKPLSESDNKQEEEDEEEDDTFYQDHEVGKSSIILMRVPAIDSMEVMEYVQQGVVTHEEATAMIRGKLGMQDLSVPKQTIQHTQKQITRPISRSPSKS